MLTDPVDDRTSQLARVASQSMIRRVPERSRMSVTHLFKVERGFTDSVRLKTTAPKGERYAY